MTRKDFTLIAKALADTKPGVRAIKSVTEQWQWDCKSIADAFVTINPDFDDRRFLIACGFANNNRG